MLNRHVKLSFTLIEISNLFKVGESARESMRVHENWQELLDKRVKLSSTLIEILNTFKDDDSVQVD